MLELKTGFCKPNVSAMQDGQLERYLSKQSVEPSLCLSALANLDLLVVLLLVLVHLSFFLCAASRAGVRVSYQRSAPLW